ncbi:MAG: alginate export family protein [Planctomycetota bacterium]|nr:alginate export family protein [Planctomycetota bacterium]
MTSRRVAAALAVYVSTLLVAPVAARQDVPFREGIWVQVKGVMHGDTFVASQIERVDDGSWSVKGTIEAYDAGRDVLDVGGWTIPLDERTEFQDTEGKAADRALLEPGRRVKLSLKLRDGAIERAKRVRRLEGDPKSRLRLEGQVGSVRRTDREIFFDWLGLEVRLDPQTSWDGLLRPRWIVDDEDVRPGRGVSLGRAGHLSGEVRFDYIDERNEDLADETDDDLSTGRGRVRVEWLFPSTPRVTGMVQIKAEEESEVDDPAERFASERDVTLGRAYVRLHGIFGKRGTLEVGRSRFDDERDWLFNHDLDAIRLFFDLRRLRFELSLAEELIDPVARHRDARHGLLSLTWYPAKKHALTLYGFVRDDRGLNSGGGERDFSPRYLGVRAAGEAKRWEYWLEAAEARGTIGGRDLEAHAFDVGATWIMAKRGEPALTVGYAYGSGDPDPGDDLVEDFRQSSLQLNNGKFNGVSSFRYYGEVIRPELANLKIGTLGFGWRPKRKTSIDLIYHTYDLDVPAGELVDASFDDRRLNLIDTEIGEELDLVVGYEQRKHVEFELDLGVFDPGKAFLGPKDVAGTARFKVKFLF